jgi:hypothetical protein
MSWGLRSTIVSLAGAVALALTATGAARTPVASAAGSCSVGSGYGYGYTYLTSLSVHNTSCSNGRHIVHKHGKVSGWHCNTQRLSTSPVQYQDRVTCTSGSAKVVWTFTQNR